MRSPRLLLLFWQQDRLRAQNLLRRFLLTHHCPPTSDKPLVVPIFASGWGGTPATIHEDVIHKIVEHNLPAEYYWIDAEWYGEGFWWQNPGNWQLKKDLYPRASSL